MRCKNKNKVNIGRMSLTHESRNEVCLLFIVLQQVSN